METGSPVPVVVVAGPTASGKSRLALEIGRRFRGTIINADAMQVYRGLAVLTAAPDAAAMAAVPHRLYGFLDPAETCSAGRWRMMAVQAIDEAVAADRLPVVVGGSGLYLRALMSGLADVPPIAPAVRESVRARLAREGAAVLHDELRRRDPHMAARLRPGDGQRIARALEVLDSTGRSLSDWLRADASGARAERYRFFVLLLLPPRARLYEAIDARFRAMLDEGGLDEVRALAARGLDTALPVMKALGVPDLQQHLAGRLSREEAMQRAQQATRRYAKRQFTWFRHQLFPDRVIKTQFSERLPEEIFSEISSFLLTHRRGVSSLTPPSQPDSRAE